MYPQSYVYPNDALTLLDPSHPLGSKAQKQFQSLSMSEVGDREWYARFDSEIKARGLILEEKQLDEDPTLFSRHLAALCAVLPRLSLNCNV